MSKYRAPDEIAMKSIELIIQNTRMNKLVWERVSDFALKAENTEIYIKNGEITFADVWIQKAPTTLSFGKGIKYLLELKDRKVTDEYNPVKVLGMYLFGEDYNKSYKEKR